MMKVARVTLSDRASAGIYEDLSGPRIEEVFAADWTGAIEWRRLLLRDERSVLEATLRRLCDEDGCALILTTGGTGPAPRDITPEATRAVIERELPGFGEIMRTRSFATVPTAILSRALGGSRGSMLTVNLPGNPRAIGECLPLLHHPIRVALKHLRGE